MPPTITDQPDDPNNPRRPKPPRYEDPKTHRDEFRNMAEFCESRFAPIVSRQKRLEQGARNFLGYCFIAETGHLASEVTLVTQKKNGMELFWFEKREPDDPVWKKELAALRDQVRVLEAENLLLKRRAGL